MTLVISKLIEFNTLKYILCVFDKKVYRLGEIGNGVVTHFST